jgi:predicted DNA-binding transcriptional regulator AlpA
MKLIRYPDLVAKGVINNRMTLKRLIDNHDFPPGKLIGANIRAWEETEVDCWLVARPVARKPARTATGPAADNQARSAKVRP